MNLEIFQRVWHGLPKKLFLAGLTTLILLITLEIIATTLIPYWRQFFFNVLEKKDASNFSLGIIYFLVLMGSLVVAQSLKQFIGRRTALQCRTVLTNILLTKWTKGGNFSEVDNPCQRINEDCRIATDLAVKVFIEVVISGTIVIMLVIEAMHNMHIIYGATIYTLAASAGALLFRRGLVTTEIQMQKAEADHRFALSQISLRLGDYTAVKKYEIAKNSVLIYLNRLLGFTVFSVSQGQFSVLIPWILLSVPYFKGQMSLGDFMAGVATFELIVVNSTILIQLFPEVTKAEGSWKRISTFYKSIS